MTKRPKVTKLPAGYAEGAYESSPSAQCKKASGGVFYELEISEQHDPRTKLWRAVIVQAMLDAKARGSRRETKNARRDALEWLFGDSPDFKLVCDLAGMNADDVRRRCMKAKEREFAWSRAPQQMTRAQFRVVVGKPLIHVEWLTPPLWPSVDRMFSDGPRVPAQMELPVLLESPPCQAFAPRPKGKRNLVLDAMMARFQQMELGV